MASQSGLTQVSLVAASLANKAIPPWPNSDQSIDNTIDGVPICGKTYWSLQGPAYEAWKIFNRKIGQTLIDREDELYTGLSKGSAPHSWWCFMVGRVKIKARPYIVIVCSQSSVRIRIMNIIKGSDWWSAQLRRYPGFGRFSLLPYAPYHLGGTGEGGHIWAPLSSLNDRLFSTPVFARHDQPISNAAALRHLATIGGIVYLDCRPYGLTVAHASEELQNNIESDLESSPSDEEFWQDPLDNDTNLDKDKGLVSPLENSNAPIGAHAVYRRSSNLVDGPSILLGRLAHQSSPKSDDGTNWALVELSESTVLRMEMQKASAKSDLNLMSYNDPGIWLPQDVATKIPDQKHVFMTGSSGRLIRGTFHNHRSLVRLAGSDKYRSLYTVNLNEDFVPGDCGKWIFNSQGNWYGHVVAGLPGLRMIYVDLASEIRNSIRHNLNVSSFNLIESEFLVKAFLKASGGASMVEHVTGRFRFGSRWGVETFEPTIARLDSNSTLATWSTSWKDQLIAAALPCSTDSATYQSYRTALKYVSGRVVQLFPDQDVRSSKLAIDRACEGGYEQVLQLLLNREVVAGPYDVMVASKNGHEKVVQMLLDKGLKASSDAVRIASARGHERTVELLLARGAVADKTSLKQAAEMGYERIVPLLLDSGVAARSETIEAACRSGSEQIVRLLLDRGVTASSRAFWIAMEKGDERIAQLLLEEGAPADSVALLEASKCGYKEVVRSLLNAGVQVDERIIRYARAYGHHEIAQMLRGDEA